METILILVVIVAVAGFYGFNAERINRIFRVKNKKAMDKIDDPEVKIQDYLERIKQTVIKLDEDSKAVYKFKRSEEDSIDEKKEKIEESNDKARYNMKTNPDLAKKYLAKALNFEEKIKKSEAKIVEFEKRMQRNKETQENLDFKREELQEMLQDVKRNKALSKLGNVSELLSQSSFTELNIMMREVEDDNRMTTYDQEYVSEVNAPTVTFHSAKVEEAFAKLQAGE